MPTVETTLYFANWCGHCHKFMGEWNNFATKINKSGGEIEGTNNIKVIANKYEESSIKGDKPTINGKDIRGYPTVKISIKDEDGQTVEYEYNGKRTSEALLDHISNHALNNLKNGEGDEKVK